MKSQQSDAAGSSLAKAGLSACVLGLVLSPFGYIAIGALNGFAPALSFVALPPLLASVGYLLFRLLSKRGAGSASKWSMLAELVSWILIAAFLVVVSGFSLQTGFERIGLFSMLFLVASVVALPVVLMRTTALGERLGSLPHGVAMFLLLAVLLAAVVAMAAYLLRTPVFI